MSTVSALSPDTLHADLALLEAQLVKNSLQAMNVLEEIMADRANRPKEAFQAARLLLQKSAGLFKLLRQLLSGQPSSSDDGGLKPQHLAHMQAMANQLTQVAQTVQQKRKKDPHRYDAFLPHKKKGR